MSPLGQNGSPPTLVIASGKGGTGKTTVSVNLAVAAARAGVSVVLVDADVEEPNDHLFLPIPRPSVREVTIPVPEVDQERCSVCGACRDACRFGAIRIFGDEVIVFPDLCHGCGACLVSCMPGALEESPRRVGQVAWGEVDPFVCCTEKSCALTLVSGTMDIGDVHAPDIIREARKIASTIPDTDVVIVDASPGVSCSAVAAAKGADALLLVTEPSIFGIHDLTLAIELGEMMGLPMGVFVNRAHRLGQDVHGLCEASSIPLLGEIPFDRRAAKVHASGGLLIDEHPSGRAWFDQLWDETSSLLLGAVVST